jgi:hypothetical protein
VQAVQEAGAVGDVVLGLERLLEVGERVRVVHQVDLHAAHVDVPLAAAAQRVDVGHRLRLGREVAAVGGARRRLAGSQRQQDREHHPQPAHLRPVRRPRRAGACPGSR